MEVPNRSQSSDNKLQDTTQARAGRPKSAEKRDNILIAASQLFLQEGFTATSMDQVASAAGVSKQTVYSHFKNKDALFSAVIDLKCREYQLDTEHMADGSHSVESTLARMANQFVSLMQDESVIAMYRVVIGEATSNPHVAELFYEAGPQYGCKLLADFLLSLPPLHENKAQAHELALVFFNMLKADFHMRSLLGLPYRLSDKEQQAHVQQVVNHFMRLLP